MLRDGEQGLPLLVCVGVICERAAGHLLGPDAGDAQTSPGNRGPHTAARLSHPPTPATRRALPGHGPSPPGRHPFHVHCIRVLPQVAGARPRPSLPFRTRYLEPMAPRDKHASIRGWVHSQPIVTGLLLRPLQGNLHSGRGETGLTRNRGDAPSFLRPQYPALLALRPPYPLRLWPRTATALRVNRRIGRGETLLSIGDENTNRLTTHRRPGDTPLSWDGGGITLRFPRKSGFEETPENTYEGYPLRLIPSPLFLIE